ncbi:MFS transporter [Amycolatopsis taiwanensis]|uniref:MFS transporter n=1 Tax=Amycolatopsis taiwanensis TaxID=342230 RepID=UPI0025529AA2|nr:MFS transporter [Amycolatopsis taiwanensis]
MSTKNLATAGSRADIPATLTGRAAVIAIGAVMIASFMDLLDATIVVVAGPALASSLDASPAQLQWVLAAYTLALGSGLITGGRLGDSYGRRRVFLAGLAAFVVFSALCALATGPGWLIIARTGQGMAAGLMVPQTFGLIRCTLAPAAQARAFGAFGAIQGLAAAAGPLLGGLLVNADLFGLGWRTIFWVNVPIGVVAFVLGARVLPESTTGVRARLDLAGVVISVGAMLLILVPLVQGREWGWPWWGFLLMATGAVLLAVFGMVEAGIRRRGAQPLLDPALLRVRSVAAGLVVSLLFFGAISAFFLTLSVYLQDGTDRSAWATGLIVLPYALGSMATSGVGVALAGKAGRRLLITGALVLAGSQGLLWWLVGGGQVPGYWSLAAALFVGGLGLGLAAPILINIVLAGVPGRDAGAAGGVLSTVTQLGGATGVAALGTLFFTVLADQPATGEQVSRFSQALSSVLTWEIALYLAVAAIMLLLPRTTAQAHS